MTSGHRARKRFGQNFLEHDGIINQIIRAINAQENHHLVEIGPGQGALTSELLASGCKLEAVELDRDLVPLLLASFSVNDKFTLHQGDALRFNFKELYQAPKKLRIVGNLPYNISTPLIFHLLEQRDIVEDMHFMLQLEVVRRMAASPGNKNYGRLSIMCQYYCQVEELFEVPPEAFNPQPKVNSAIVRLLPYETLPIVANDVERLQAILREAFNTRRKTLRNTLKNYFTAEELESLGINPTARPDTLSLEQYVTLSNYNSTES